MDVELRAVKASTPQIPLGTTSRRLVRGGETTEELLALLRDDARDGGLLRTAHGPVTYRLIPHPGILATDHRRSTSSAEVRYAKS